MGPEAGHVSLGSRLAVRDPGEARGLLASLAGTVEALLAVVETETACLARGRLREGLTHEGRKTELVAAYLRGLEAVKANIVALRRLAPESLSALKEAQIGLSAALARNQAVLSTARAVSDDLIKALAEEVGRSRRLHVYAPGAQPARRPDATAPLVLSRHL